jgi:hypothetical protein
MPFLRRSFPLLLLILIFGLVTACSNTPTPTEAPTPAVTASPVATETPSPTPTNPPPLAILLAPESADAALVATLQEKMAALATQDGLQFETRPSLTATDANPNLRIVVAISPDPGIAQLAASAPETQFLALGIPGIQPSANLSVVGGSDGLPDQMGFIAGYLAAVITDDWRAGVISSDDATGQIAAQGFRNGLVFFCGLCRPSFPPFYEYPILASPPGQAAIDSLVSQGVQTAYLPPEASDPALFESLAQANLNLIGSTPPPENLKDRWVATIQTNLPAGLERLWSEMVGGKGGVALPTPIVITDRNEALFSIGRQRLVDETLAAMQAGYIGTGVTPP